MKIWWVYRFPSQPGIKSVICYQPAKTEELALKALEEFCYKGYPINTLLCIAALRMTQEEFDALERPISLFV